MSFQDLAKNGGRELSNYQSQATREVEQLIFKLVSNVTQLRKHVDKLGTVKDTLDHRHTIANVNNTIQELAKLIKDKLTGLHDAAPAPTPTAARGAAAGLPPNLSPSPEQQLKTRRLLQDFANILQEYKTLQRVAAEREAASLPRQPPPRPGAGRGGAGPSLTTPLLDPTADSSSSRGAAAAGDDVEAAVRRQAVQQAEVASLEGAVTYNEALIAERDAGIAEIQRQIGEVHEMFQDLAVLIADQGEQLQTVDTHITAVAERVVEGQRHLTAASRSGRAARNKCLMLWLVAAVIVSVLLIILLA